MIYINSQTAHFVLFLWNKGPEGKTQAVRTCLSWFPSQALQGTMVPISATGTKWQCHVVLVTSLSLGNFFRSLLNKCLFWKKKKIIIILKIPSVVLFPELPSQRKQQIPLVVGGAYLQHVGVLKFPCHNNNPRPLQWQTWILNWLCHKRTPWIPFLT